MENCDTVMFSYPACVTDGDAKGKNRVSMVGRRALAGER